MASITSGWVVEQGKKIVALFDDGFQIKDVLQTVSLSMEAVGRLSDLDGPQKKEAAVNLVNYVIDEVDLPFIPDALVDPILKRVVPDAIDYLHGAAKGKFNFG